MESKDSANSAAKTASDDINRITVEFKALSRDIMCIIISILIESQWNLKELAVPEWARILTY